MCGICCVCSLAPASVDEQCPFLNMGYVGGHSLIPRRGPDMQKSVTGKLWSEVEALFGGFVLHLRGPSLTPQPLVNSDGDVLLWNGEIFDGIEVKKDENDTQVLFQHLVKCESEQDILTIVQSIQGPWSLIFWQARKEKLWFGRDVFGRRSLLWHLPQDDRVFALSSVPISPLDFEEIPSVGLFCMEASRHSLDSQGLSSGNSGLPPGHPSLSLSLYPWRGATWPGTEEEVSAAGDADTLAQKLHLDHSPYISVRMHPDQTMPSWMPVINPEIPPDDGSLLNVEGAGSGGGDLAQVLKEMEKRGGLATLVTQLQNVLQKAVKKRVLNVPQSSGCRPRLGDLPGSDGGDDKEEHCDHQIARLDIHSNDRQPFMNKMTSTHNSSHTPVSEKTSSSNNCLTGAQSGVQIIDEERDANSSCQTKISQVCDDSVSSVSMIERQTPSSEQRQNGSDISEELNATAFPLQRNTKPATVAVLFSGGVDSTVLAALADRCMPSDESIDLVNVAFEQTVSASQTNRKKGKQVEEAAASTVSHYNVPDRQTGYLALSELNPQRHWNFVEVNVTQEMLQKHRSEHVRHLVYPLKTVLDDSIGCALWFAAGGRGVLGNGSDKGAPYTSTAKVVVCGMGADEQLAGYSRHRGRFQQESWAGLIAEINMEIHRISARNLGRDDRIIADHGKESRFPFLDEEVVAFLASLPIHHKADLRLPRGVGEKLLLRLLALRLGLPQTSALPKRAIQFGSRIAKLEKSKEKGNQVCQRLV